MHVIAFDRLSSTAFHLDIERKKTVCVRAKIKKYYIVTLSVLSFIGRTHCITRPALICPPPPPPPPPPPTSSSFPRYLGQISFKRRRLYLKEIEPCHPNSNTRRVASLARAGFFFFFFFFFLVSARRPGAGIMKADDRQVTTVFTVLPSFHHPHSTNRVS